MRPSDGRLSAGTGKDSFPCRQSHIEMFHEAGNAILQDINNEENGAIIYFLIYFQPFSGL